MAYYVGRSSSVQYSVLWVRVWGLGMELTIHRNSTAAMGTLRPHGLRGWSLGWHCRQQHCGRPLGHCRVILKGVWGPWLTCSTVYPTTVCCIAQGEQCGL